ncbi:proteasome subunit alpha type 6 [Histoplasma capsulatum]|uniref:Proteasome subunit alpha type 6 n=1 Tax=Ajellomyces capsulatus TaxID=5037 RepID=A0A8A1MFV1_AJECA|nr:predicted protein [Histoplasma mississippiense (nom. inval.)]EDN02188.1 predicted protein [Histoplasma mississippiense (nom. inval.)]QSS64799.1 proteasome subunit alpha type 6 [Histoplasma capsulatum]
MAARIPAWKKLGLQLKNAATSVIENTSFQSKGTKKRPLTSESEESNGKKPRVENVKINEKTKRENTKENTNDKTPRNKATNPELVLSLESSSVENQDNKPLSKPKSKKIKSVSFAEDTKLEDGDGVVALELENEHEDAREPSPAVARKAEKRKLKREQRAKNRPDSTSNAPPPPIDPTLQYLTLYHKSRAQWKFQKNRETHLLKHALSVDRIPSTYNASLAAYLAGIKSEGAKKRVAEAAVEAIKADDADVDSGENGGGGSDASEKDRYRNSISSFRKRLVGLVAADPHSWEGDMFGDEATDLNADWLKKLERRRRAELVLHFVGGSVPAAEAAKLQAESRPGVSEKKKQKKQKRKKNRTNVIEDTSSSSSGSSSSSETDSDSDSDSDDFNSKPTTEQVSEITKSTTNGLHNDSSSSSESEISSSDSSSDSDSDTDSD